MKVISVNVGLPREVMWKGKTVTTGIFKDPVQGSVRVGRLNLEGDRQADLSVHGVDSEFMCDLKSYGLQPAAADLSQLRMHGVSAEYLKGLKEAGYGNLRVDEINQLRNNGVEPEFPREARRLGYDFTPEELAQLRTHGVDSQYLRHLQDTGMRNLSADQITQLRIHGVD